MAQETDQDKKDVRPSFVIGANLWYTWWKPAWEKIRVDRLIPGWHINPEIDATVDFGINAAVRFNDSWSLTTVLNFGEYSVTVQKYFPLPVPIKPKFESKAQRFDLDTTAGYSISQYVMFFAGLKYRGCMVRLRYIRSYSFNTSYAGPEAGFGFALPIVSSLSFSPVVSGIIMGGRERDGSSAQAGCAISGAFAYKTLSSRMIISIGGRYEYLKYLRRVDPYCTRDSGQVYGMMVTLSFVF
jgi:hypothetical protein